MANEVFSVKSFYNFLNEGGLQCPISSWLWRNNYPRKVNLFNWLTWKNKILTLENLEKQCFNKLPTATCVFCHAGIELVDHLFLHCSFAKHVWKYFVRLLHLPEPPILLSYLIWVSWRSRLQTWIQDVGVWIMKALIWNIWLARNDRIFNANVVHAADIIMKCDRMIFSWFTVIVEGARGKFEDYALAIRHSLKFLDQRAEETNEVLTAEEASEQHTG
ncbi:uncharacterized protein LOC120260211 [Dioscorea cayenensis subsp. rotundata]|uniref:Uncharacterized protein LOC120260211 n=1 Tax=Dioscorea cayennensis subsp. rotundata TaxID=55577 RepID=A0AB40BA99_DIOCR|nr:uncharacterized protein LOC120260211 [Dioscorea cayenensis subsp. rotundata]